MEPKQFDEKQQEAIRKLFLDDITDIAEAEHKQWLIAANRQNGKSAAIEAIVDELRFLE